MELMTIEEVSEVTRVPVPTLRWWRSTNSGGPRSARVGRRVMYRRADVEAWIEDAFK
ncbi:MAG: helix-turn-helix domain-containing protein [Anaerolineae bacterium]|nr:helix-turn-helix domain-containing protein [Caldilineaceae bacterium]MCB0255738.1 helix-turn-helix domain-containing protein [Anaerolineae bacterium]